MANSIQANSFKLVSCLTLFLLLFVSGCAPSARVPVVKPAEINMSQYRKIAFGDSEGSLGESMTDLLTSRLFNSEYFEVVDRQNIDRIMSEHRFNLSGAVDETSAAEIGNLAGVDALFFIKSSGDFNQTTEISEWHKDQDNNSYRYFHKKGKANVNTTFKVIDVSTGRVLAVKSLSKTASGENWEKNAWPPDVDREPLLSKAASETLDDIMKMIAPYKVYVNISFATTKDLNGKSGIDFAKNGMWNEALEQFVIASENNPGDYASKYNLGLGYQYTYQLDKAISTFKEAMKIKPDGDCTKAISSCTIMKADIEKLNQQL
ncbi:MAG: CsgG/HfaB family protein [Syntrophotaleaceae bacterium]